LNVVALIVPFMTIEVFMKGLQVFNVTSLVSEMWKAEVYWCTVLVVAFSLVFPFVKLISLTILWFLPSHTGGQRSFLRVLSYVGRFSLLDIFVELIVLALAHNQGSKTIGFGKFKKTVVLFETETHLGLPMFIAAIILNMICSEAMCWLEKPQ